MYFRNKGVGGTENLIKSENCRKGPSINEIACMNNLDG